MQQILNNYRTMFLFRGLAALAFGILTLVWPNISLFALVLVFGVFAVIWPSRWAFGVAWRLCCRASSRSSSAC